MPALIYGQTQQDKSISQLLASASNSIADSHMGDSGYKPYSIDFMPKSSFFLSQRHDLLSSKQF